MKLFIDDANVDDIRRVINLYPIDGVTTNPGILAKTGKDPREVLRQIRDVVGKEASVFAQTIDLTANGMLRDAHMILDLLGENTVVKIPAIPEGFKAIRLLKAEGIQTCATVVYTPMQAFLAAKSGASYAAPYVNRIDDMGFDGARVVREIQDIMINNQMDCEVLAASFKNSQQILELVKDGVNAVTAAPSVIEKLVRNAAIDAAVLDFANDFKKLTGCETMEELGRKEFLS